MKTKKSESALQVKLRASLIYRIAMEFAVLFFVTGLFLLCIFVLIRLGSVSGLYQGKAADFSYALEKESIDREKLEAECMCLTVTAVESNEVVYQIGKEPGRFHIGKWYFKKPDDTLQLYVTFRLPVLLYGAECNAKFIFDCTEEWSLIRGEMLCFALWYVGIMVVAVLIGSVLIKAVLRPIEEMSVQVSRFNLQNIHKERLSVEGSKDELKALATVINEMLDRMEQTYEAQKQFVSEASHELRTPITVLQGYSSM